MKKLMTLMLGLSLALGAVATVFAQRKQDDTGMTSKKKKGGKKKAEAPKKQGSR